MIGIFRLRSLLLMCMVLFQAVKRRDLIRFILEIKEMRDIMNLMNRRNRLTARNAGGGYTDQSNYSWAEKCDEIA